MFLMMHICTTFYQMKRTFSYFVRRDTKGFICVFRAYVLNLLLLIDN